MNIVYIVVIMCSGHCVPEVKTYRDAMVTGEAIMESIRDGRRVSVWKSVCIGGGCKDTLLATNVNRPTFNEMADESAAKTDAEFCKKATEPWQKKAFCRRKE